MSDLNVNFSEVICQISFGTIFFFPFLTIHNLRLPMIKGKILPKCLGSNKRLNIVF